MITAIKNPLGDDSGFYKTKIVDLFNDDSLLLLMAYDTPFLQ